MTKIQIKESDVGCCHAEQGSRNHLYFSHIKKELRKQRPSYSIKNAMLGLTIIDKDS